jgi:hypothetical protein
MQRHWARFGPPAYVAAALYLGLNKPQPGSAEPIRDPDDLADLLAAMPWARRAAG